MLADRIRAMTAPHWLALFGAIALAWVALYLMSVPAEVRALRDIYGNEFWDSLCTLTPDAAGFLRMTAMWALMSGAMMAPTVLPALATYEDLGRSTDTRMGLLITGYMTVWMGFSVLAAALQLVLLQIGLLDPLGQSAGRLFSALLLAGAGLYQFAPLKEACLSKCRTPLNFFMAHWDEGAWRNGLRLGLVCLGCCWALMGLAFVGGVMNLGFMALATVIMMFEKLPVIGRYVTRPLGGLLIATAGLVAIGVG